MLGQIFKSILKSKENRIRPIFENQTDDWHKHKQIMGNEKI